MQKGKTKSIRLLYEAMQDAEQNVKSGKAVSGEPEFFDLKKMKDFFKRFLNKKKTAGSERLLSQIQSINDFKLLFSTWTTSKLETLLKESAKAKILPIRQLVLLELSKRDFWYYCQLKAPHFYKDQRAYLKTLCRTLPDFYENDAMVLIINLPPRHGKSFTASLFAQWVFGKNTQAKIMTGSYNEKLSTSFSKTVRNSIAEKKASDDVVVYHDVFPDTQIKQGDASMTLWSLEGAYASYLATSPTGTATGFGASLMIIDDLIKSHYEASNELLLEDQWKWFTDTMLSRLEEKGKIIIIMTRWASGDLAGRATEHFAEMEIPCEVVSMKAVQEDGSMLCDDVLSKESYLMKTKTMSQEIASANYQQIPVDIKGKLYGEFKTYDTLEGLKGKFTGIYAYIDTADEGTDYLSAYVFGVYNNEAYIIDTLFTQDAMEFTEPEAARLLTDNEVGMSRIESNNGGRGFARAVLTYLQNVLHNYRTSIKCFCQHKNKKARILSNATWVMEHVYFPANWRYRWPELYKDLTKYQRSGKNAHDDAADAITGIAETMFKLGA